MAIKKLSKSKMCGVLSLVVLIALLTSTLISVNAESTILYLDWKLEGTPIVYGHLTLSNFPNVMEENKTYKIEATLTLESGNNQDLGYLYFRVHFSEEDSNADLGYSYINTTLNRADSVALISHWKIADLDDYNEGKLVVESDKGIFTLSPEDIKIKFPTKNILSMNVPEEVNRGDALPIEGSMNPSEEGAKISLTYIKPNGTEIIRVATIDRNGTFTDNFAPDIEGTWWVKASFNGTKDYAASSTNLSSFRVQPVMPSYLIIAAIGFVVWLSTMPFIYKYKINTQRIYGNKSNDKKRKKNS